MIVESIGHLWRWVRDRQTVEIQRQVYDPKTNKTWWEYHTLVYNGHAKVIEAEKLGSKIDKTA